PSLFCSSPLLSSPSPLFSPLLSLPPSLLSSPLFSSPLLSSSDNPDAESGLLSLTGQSGLRSSEEGHTYRCWLFGLVVRSLYHSLNMACVCVCVCARVCVCDVLVTCVCVD